MSKIGLLLGALPIMTKNYVKSRPFCGDSNFDRNMSKMELFLTSNFDRKIMSKMKLFLTSNFDRKIMSKMKLFLTSNFDRKIMSKIDLFLPLRAKFSVDSSVPVRINLLNH
jgi:hypothetical protein